MCLVCLHMGSIANRQGGHDKPKIAYRLYEEPPYCLSGEGPASGAMRYFVGWERSLTSPCRPPLFLH